LLSSLIRVYWNFSGDGLHEESRKALDGGRQKSKRKFSALANSGWAYLWKLERTSLTLQTYLHPSSLEKLMVICERALIERRLEDFYAEFKNLLDNELDVEAAMMFRLAKKIKGNLTLT
jgi:hypothetical protein